MQIFDWPWMTGVSIVGALGMAWLVRASFRRRIKRAVIHRERREDVTAAGKREESESIAM